MMKTENNNAKKYFADLPDGLSVSDIGTEKFQEILENAIHDPNFDQDAFIDVLFSL